MIIEIREINHNSIYCLHVRWRDILDNNYIYNLFPFLVCFMIIIINMCGEMRWHDEEHIESATNGMFVTTNYNHDCSINESINYVCMHMYACMYARIHVFMYEYTYACNVSWIMNHKSCIDDGKQSNYKHHQ